jgi:RHS repeat-associated protein
VSQPRCGFTALSADRYDPYGNRAAHTGTVDSPIGYSGNWTDPTTGLIYLRARDYDPHTAQFLSVDPYVDQTHQPYAYVGNSPLLSTDPTGLFAGESFIDTLVTSGPADWLAGVLTTGVTGDVATTFEGIGDGVTGGLTGDIRNVLSPGSNCFVNHNGFYFGGTITGALFVIIATAGAGGEVGLADAGDLAENASDIASTVRGDSAGDGYAADIIDGGREDGQTVFAGHGELRSGDTTTVPEGTTLNIYSNSAGKLSDIDGQAIESGAARAPTATYGPGDAVPNYTLKTPDNLTVYSGSTTVDESTPLSQLLRPNMGICHWAACTVNRF